MDGSKSLKINALLIAAASTVAVATPAFAGLSFQFVGTTALPNSWPASAALGTLPVIDSGDNGVQGSPFSAIANGSNDNETLLPGKEEAETFTPASNFTLGAISFLFSGPPQPGADLSLHLFQLDFTNGSSGGYTLSTAEVGPDLLGGGNGLPFTYNGSNELVTEFDFNNSGTTDQVPLTAGNVYALEIWNDDNGNNTYISRTNLVQTYPGGQNYAEASGEGDAQEPFSPESRDQVVSGEVNLLFAVYPTGAVTAANGNWISTTGGTWGSATNWSNSVIPATASSSANFGPGISANSTVNLDANRTVGVVTFNNTNSYTLAAGSPAGILVMDNGGNTATASITNSAGKHVISAPIQLGSNLSISVVNPGDSLTLSGQIASDSFFSEGITIGGAGTTILSGNNIYYGGGTTITGGTTKLGSSGGLSPNGTLYIAAGTLDLNGQNPIVGTLYGDGTIDNVSAGGTASIVTGRNGNATSTFSGFIVNTSGSVSLAYEGTGTLDLAPRARGTFASNSYTGGTTISSGTVIIGNNLGLPSGSNVVNNGVLSIEAGGNSLVIAGNISGTGTLQVGNTVDGNGGFLQLAPGSGAHSFGNITVAAGSTLDITNNRLVINYGTSANDPTAAIAAALASGFNGGNWAGPGIDSSAANLNSSKFSVGYIDGDVTTDAQGKTVAANQLKVAYTLLGDAYLENSVGFDDLVVVAQNFGKTGKDWANGNFNYDPSGSVGFADLVSVAQNFGSSSGVAQGISGAGLSPAWQTTQNQSVIPEPTSLAMGLAAAAGLLARRRRNR